MRAALRAAVFPPPSTVAYEAEATALFARMTSEPDATRKGHINTLIAALKTATVWTKIDCLYVMAAHDAQAARLNWISSSFNLTAVNSPTFTTDRGYAGNGSSSRLTTNFTPSTHAVQFAQDDASIWVWSLTSGLGTYDAGNQSTTPQVLLAARFGDGNQYSTVNGGVNTGASSADGIGFFGGQRRSSSNVRLWKNGSQTATNSSTSAGLSTQEQWICGANNAVFSTKQIAAAAWGASLTGLEAAFYNALLTYMQAVGVA